MNHTKSVYKDLANCIRVLAVDAIEKAASGHPGMPLGMADVATVLYSEFFNFNPQDAQWLNRDKMILSAGHGSMLLYSLLYLTGYPSVSLEEIKNFRQLHSKTAGHPEYGLLEGVESSTGPLGQGFGNAVGMALSAKISNAKLHEDILSYKVYSIVGDGCLMEGISHEVASLAGHLQLDNLIVLYDDNGITIDGKKDLADSENVLERFKAYNWNVYQIDGHNYDQIHTVLTKAQNSDRPVLISCKTKIGYGSPNKEGTEKCHGAPLGKDEVSLVKKSYSWSQEPFYIPEKLLKVWRYDIGQRSKGLYDLWCNKVDGLSERQKKIVTHSVRDIINDNKDMINDIVLKLKNNSIQNKGEQATRNNSGEFIEAVGGIIPLCGGSADLSGSNCSKTKNMSVIKAGSYSGNYIHYGIREHAMGAVMNGIALCNNMCVYGSSFLVFVDYMRPSIRMAALMKLPVIYVMTHDSIGVGEDGPTHQPIEQIASLRAMPNLNVFRPADATETTECWQLALESSKTPSVLCLTRQKVSQVRTDLNKDNLCARGGYILSDSASTPEIVILATGSEVSLALSVKNILNRNNINVRVVSVPSLDLLLQQSQEYINFIIPKSSMKVVIEAACSFGWDSVAGNKSLFFCIDRFGESGPAQDLFEYFGFNAEKISKSIMNKCRG